MKTNTLLLGLVLLAGHVASAVDYTPAGMVSTVTNSYTHGMLSGTNAQQDFNFIDAELSRQSNAVIAASNLAAAAYALASVSNASAVAQRSYSYQNTGTWTMAVCTTGQAYCWAATQSIGKIHVGMYVTGTVFSANTQVTNVDYAERKVFLSLVCASGNTNVSCSFWGTNIYTHVVPTNFARCRVTVTGGGGAGGADDSAADAGGGGGAGGTSIGWWSLAEGASYTVTVGNGGAAVTNAATGTTGGTSSFGALQTATGGSGGTDQSASISYGGLGGLGTGGQLLIRGGTGLDGGGSRGGYGGSSYWGGGGSGNDNLTSKQKSASPSIGAGGGGGTADDASGAGGHGIVVVEYY